MNRRVVVVGQSKEYGTRFLPFPPIGTLGTTISGMDEDGDYDVMFDDHPCPSNNPDESWVTHKSLIIFIGTETIENRSAECADA